jgi:hypothetical protein
LCKLLKMKRNKILSLALIIVRLAQGLVFLALALLAVDLILHFMNPQSTFVRWEWYFQEEESVKWLTEGGGLEQSHFSYYFNWLQVTLQLILMGFIWNELRKVLFSVKSFFSFISSNVQHLLNISRYLLFLWATSLFHFFSLGGLSSSKVQLDFDIGYLLLALAVYILAEVFKEAKLLADDQKMIV